MFEPVRGAACWGQVVPRMYLGLATKDIQPNLVRGDSGIARRQGFGGHD